jgi:hypothetical protein
MSRPSPSASRAKETIRAGTAGITTDGSWGWRRGPAGVTDE